MVWTATRTLVLCLAGFLSIHSLSAAAGQASGAWTVLLDGNEPQRMERRRRRQLDRG